MADSLDQNSLKQMLLDAGQEHLFENFGESASEEKMQLFFTQVAHLNNTYPGGIPSYIRNAKVKIFVLKKKRLVIYFCHRLSYWNQRKERIRLKVAFLRYFLKLNLPYFF